MRRTFFCLIFLMMLIALPTQAQEDDLTPYEIALQRIEEARVSGTTELGLWDLNLTELPAEIGQLTNLQFLYLSDNQLSSLPAEIGQLINLEWLYLSDNYLSSLPAEIGQLTNLQYLYLSYNQLSSLPAEIGQLTNLQELILWNNHLSNLPAEIGQLTNLEILYLAGNQLSSLPAEIGQLANLCHLNLTENNLHHLPNTISNLTKLVQSETCSRVDMNSGLYVSSNPLISPPPEIIEQGTPVILAYLRNQAWWHLQRLIIGAASSIGLLAAVFLGLRIRQKRMRRKKKT